MKRTCGQCKRFFLLCIHSLDKSKPMRGYCNRSVPRWAKDECGPDWEDDSRAEACDLFEPK